MYALPSSSTFPTRSSSHTATTLPACVWCILRYMENHLNLSVYLLWYQKLGKTLHKAGNRVQNQCTEHAQDRDEEQEVRDLHEAEDIIYSGFRALQVRYLVGDVPIYPCDRSLHAGHVPFHGSEIAHRLPQLRGRVLHGRGGVAQPAGHAGAEHRDGGCGLRYRADGAARAVQPVRERVDGILHVTDGR